MNLQRITAAAETPEYTQLSWSWSSLKTNICANHPTSPVLHCYENL